jgi:hypothetical protein
MTEMVRQKGISAGRIWRAAVPPMALGRDITPCATEDNIGGNVYWTTSAGLQAPVPRRPATAVVATTIRNLSFDHL